MEFEFVVSFSDTLLRPPEVTQGGLVATIVCCDREDCSTQSRLRSGSEVSAVSHGSSCGECEEQDFCPDCNACMDEPSCAVSSKDDCCNCNCIETEGSPLPPPPPPPPPPSLTPSSYVCSQKSPEEVQPEKVDPKSCELLCPLKNALVVRLESSTVELPLT